MDHLALVLGVALVIMSFAVPLAGAQDTRQAPRHPSLYFSADDLPRLRERLKTPPFDARFRALAANADAFVGEPVTRVAAGQISNSRRALGISGICSFAYAMTGDRKYADRARAEVLALVVAERWHEPKNWNNGAELATAEASLACALFYDWCHDTLDDETRARVASRIFELGIQPYLASVEEHKDWWVSNPVTNWCGVCHGGVGVAALALADENPEARRAAGLAREHLLAFLSHAVGGDGGGHEGVMYWRYGMEFTHYFLTAAQRKLPGDDLDAALAATADRLAGYWDVAMQAPDGKYANFNNMNEETFAGLYAAGKGAHEGGPNAALCALFERHAARANGGAGDRLLLWAADHGGGPYYYRGTSPFWFLWRRDVAPADPEMPTLPDAMLFRTAGHAIWRSPDLWLAYNAGWTSDKSHNNRDLGSFVLVYKGERFVADPGYGHADAANHSTIVIDGGDQVRGKGAKYLGWLDRPDVKYLVSDLSDVYPQQLDRFERQLVLVDGRVLVIVDDIEAPEPHAYESRLQTRLTPAAANGAAATVAGEKSSLHVVPVLPKGVRVAGGKQQINYVSITQSGKSSAVFVTILYPDAAGSAPPRATLDQSNGRATIRVTAGNAGTSLEFTVREAWRLAKVNGQAVGDVPAPAGRTFDALR